MKQKLLVAALATALSFSTSLALAADQDQDRTRTQTQIQPEPEQVYGSQLMSREERRDYQARMRAAKTAGERQQIRNEHHQRMKKRAQAQGITLPDKPPARDRGMGQGGGGGRR